MTLRDLPPNAPGIPINRWLRSQRLYDPQELRAWQEWVSNGTGDWDYATWRAGGLRKVVEAVKEKRQRVKKAQGLKRVLK